MTEPINRENDPRWAVLESYVADLKQRMGLVIWDIWISKDSPANCGAPDVEDAKIYATNMPSNCSLSARLKFSDAFFDLFENDQRAIVVHELIHIIQMPRSRAVETIETCGALGSREWSLFKTMFEYADENATDWLALIIAPSMPLIEWEKDADSG